MGKFGGDYRSGVGKSGMLESTKAAISLKRVKIEETLLWTACRKSQTLFRTVPSPTPTASLPQDWGFATPTQTAIDLSQERLKLYGLQKRNLHANLHFAAF